MSQYDPTASANESALEGVLAGSQVISTLQHFREHILDSTVTALSTRLTRIVRASFLYRWLTAEPDPDVIVIDLRGTTTVGPFIRLLDRVLTRLEPGWTDSRLKDGVDALVALGDRAAETRPGRLLVALFEPPEPPDRDDADSPTRDDRDHE